MSDLEIFVLVGFIVAAGLTIIMRFPMTGGESDNKTKPISNLERKIIQNSWAELQREMPDLARALERDIEAGLSLDDINHSIKSARLDWQIALMQSAKYLMESKQ